MAAKPLQTVTQAKRVHREQITLVEDPHFQVPSEDPGWFARFLLEYNSSLRQTLERMQERIEQLEGHRGKPEIQADLSMLGNAIVDVATPTLAAADAQHVVTVQFMRANALMLNTEGVYVLQGDIDANGFAITNIARGSLASGAITMAEVLALLASRFSSGSFPITGVGFTVAPTGTAQYAIIDGDTVVVSFPAISGTSNASGFTLTGLPAAITPTHTIEKVVMITDGQGGGSGVEAYGVLRLTASSTTVTLFSPVNANGAWTASGPKALAATTIVYVMS